MNSIFKRKIHTSWNHMNCFAHDWIPDFLFSFTFLNNFYFFPYSLGFISQYFMLYFPFLSPTSPFFSSLNFFYDTTKSTQRIDLQTAHQLLLWWATYQFFLSQTILTSNLCMNMASTSPIWQSTTSNTLLFAQSAILLIKKPPVWIHSFLQCSWSKSFMALLPYFPCLISSLTSLSIFTNLTNLSSTKVAFSDVL